MCEQFLNLQAFTRNCLTPLRVGCLKFAIIILCSGNQVGIFFKNFVQEGNDILAEERQQMLELFDIMFWRGVANPQSGEFYDCSDEVYSL